VEYASVPRFAWPKLPEPERDFGRHLSDQFIMLASYWRDFERAVHLYDHCARLKHESKAVDPHNVRMADRALLVDWMLIAARDAAFTVYHFRSVIRSIRDQLSRTPSVLKLTDTKALEKAWLRVDQEFPTCKAVRDALGHRADMHFSPERSAEHAHATGRTIQGSLDEGSRSIVMTRNREYVSLALTQDTLRRMDSIAHDVFAAFPKSWSRQLPRENHRRLHSHASFS